MRVPEENKIPIQPLTHLWERHKEIARRLIAGDRQKDIADDLKMSYARMSIICNSPAFKSHLNRMSMGADNNALDVQDRIEVLSIDAMAMLEDALQDNTMAIDDKTRIKVAEGMLDRAGYGAVKKTQTLSAVVTSDDIEELRSRREKTINA